MAKIIKNTLFYGDNLDILREYIDDESVDLIYLDPPFNSNRSYNVLFKDESGSDSEAQITAFDDTWHWGEAAEETYYELVNNSSPEIATMISALRQFIGTNQMMAYLIMMTTRLIELKRVLKPTGSIYLHCDPTASHYLKVIMDCIFGFENFNTEIIWKRTSAHSSANKPGSIHDVMLFYSKTQEYVWNDVYHEYDEDYIEKNYSHIDSDGRRWKSTDLTGAGTSEGESGKPWRGIEVTFRGRHWAYIPSTLDKLDKEGRIYFPNKKDGMPRLKQYLEEMQGVKIQDIWNDINPISAQSAERLGYPTQKPLELLERIILASSNEGDWILDPFSGCGTAISAAQKLNRKWVGIDITQLAIALHKNRLKDMFELEVKKDYEVIGEPQSLHDANKLALDNRFQFEWWALSLIEARPAGGKKKGSDKGIDGIISFTDEAKGKVKQILVQVKSGHVNSGLIRDFRGTIERESNAVMGIFITLEKPSKNMEVEALEAGYYISPFTGQKHRNIQICTIKDLLEDKYPDLPVSATFSTFKKATKAKKESKDTQGKLDI